MTYQCLNKNLMPVLQMTKYIQTRPLLLPYIDDMDDEVVFITTIHGFVHELSETKRKFECLYLKPEHHYRYNPFLYLDE